MRAVMLALLVSCTTEKSVFVEPGVPCEVALVDQSADTFCVFTETCSRPNGLGSNCMDVASCVDHAVVITNSCPSVCADDTQCRNGLEICSGSTCESCPSTSECAACPTGFINLSRNGCKTCQCGPADTCVATETNTCGGSDLCYAGADCASGCVAGDKGCCSDQCAAKGCTGQIPTGCLTTCPTQSGVSCGGACITDHCDCVAGNWQCTSTCAHGATSSCVAP